MTQCIHSLHVRRLYLDSTHPVTFHNILSEVAGTRLGQILRAQVDQIGKLLDHLELHGTGLGVKGVPHHVEVADPGDGELLGQEVAVLLP